MTTVSKTKLVSAIAKKLKALGGFEPPAWVAVVKSGSHAERVNTEPDFWYLRCASVLMATARAPVGVRSLQVKYGGKATHTVSRGHHRKAGGKIIRVALQQLEKAGLVKKDKKGRAVSTKGISLIEKTAAA